MKDKILKRISGVFVLRKKWITAAALILCVVLIFYAVNDPAIIGASATTRLLPIYSVSRDNKAVSLSFDAAWGNEDTELLIEIFKKYDIKVTFFVVGEWVDKYPESVKALSDAGHEVMNHSNDHAHFASLESQEIISNINTCNDKIEAITGVRPTLFRAPYGEYDDDVIASVNSIGMHTIQWDVDSLDWKELGADQIFSRVKNGVQNGSIVLFHNAAINTPDALPSVIEYLLSEGYDIVPVSQLILSGDYTIDHTGRQCPA